MRSLFLLKKTVLPRAFVAAGLALAVTLAPASAMRALTGPEEDGLRRLALDEAGIESWFIRSSVLELENSNELYATVVYKAAKHPRYCLAPASEFVGTSGGDNPPVWRSPAGGRVNYRFWFHSCDKANLDSAITLRVLLDFDVLEKINAQQEHILRAVQEKLEIVREEPSALAAPELSSIDLQYDTEHGPVYQVKYSIDLCYWLSADVVFDSGTATVLEARIVVC